MLCFTHQHDWLSGLLVLCPLRSSLWNETLEVSDPNRSLDRAQLILGQPEEPCLCIPDQLMPLHIHIKTDIKQSEVICVCLMYNASLLYYLACKRWNFLLRVWHIRRSIINDAITFSHSFDVRVTIKSSKLVVPTVTNTVFIALV